MEFAAADRLYRRRRQFYRTLDGRSPPTPWYGYGDQARRKQFDIGPANPFPSPSLLSLAVLLPFHYPSPPSTPSLLLEVGPLNTVNRSGGAL